MAAGDDMQTIPARHGVATFVPAGQVIKIVNTAGTQVIDTWAFALPKPDEKGSNEKKKEEKSDEKKDGEQKDEKKEEKSTPKPTPKKSKKDGDLPSQEEAEQATQQGLKGSQEAGKETPQKSTWSSYVPTSYVPSLGLGSSSKKGDESETQKNSKTWSSYFPSGQGFSNYIPKTASDTVSAFASEHQRDTSKSYLEQLQDFSKTPVGAAGLAAVTGSGYGGSLYAGYQAWNAKNAPEAPPMEFMSMPHSRTASLHLSPKVNDVLLSNLRQPMMTLVEDTSPGIHDTLIAACDPARYKLLGVDNWEKHGSCAENLVLALKELNERAGLKGAKGVGADVTINAVPAPLNLFMNIPWDEDGDLGMKPPKSKAGDYVRLRAERDVVVVMSACPQDVLEVNAKKITDAHFIVEDEDTTQAIKRSQPAKKRPPPKKLNSSQAPSKAGGDDDDAKAGATPAKKPVPQRRTVPQKKPAGATGQAPQKKPVPKPVQPSKKPQPAEGGANGTATPPAEKKKPRKLSAKPKTDSESQKAES